MSTVLDQLGAKIGSAAALSLSSNILGIDHLAVAVPELQAAIDWTQRCLGCVLVEQRETVGRSSGMKSAVMRLGKFVLVLVQGTNPDSQVSQFVTRHGAGVQHVALQVRDIGQAIAELQQRGMAFSTPRLDSQPLSQIFSVRDPATGLMIEFIERRDYDGFSDENVQRLFESLEQKSLY